MEDDWENIEEPKVPLAAAVLAAANKWEGEDEEDEVKESWEDEEEEKKNVERVDVSSKPKPKKTLAEKLVEKERLKQEEAERKQKLIEEAMTPEERVAEKLRRQKLQEESDLKLALETFGISEDATGIDAMHPTNKAGFDELCDAISKKVAFYKANEDFPAFAEDLVRNICVNLNSFDLKKLKITIDNLYLEKQKAEKGDKAKKSKGKGKAKLKMEGDNTQLSEYTTYDDFDDYNDFM